MAEQQGKSEDLKTSETEQAGRHVTSVFFVYLVIGIGLYSLSDTFQKFVKENLVFIGLAVILVVGILLLGLLRKGFKYGTATRQIGLIIFVVIPLILGLFGAIALAPNEFEVAVLRGIFLLLVVLLPPTMYYLFIVGRKRSLLQEYFTNLSRLGLLRSQEETERERAVRVKAYIQKFEAVYGTISNKLSRSILIEPNSSGNNSKDPKLSELNDKDGVGAVFTPDTAIPVVIATILIGLGWLITLPPWELGSEAVTDNTKWGLVLSPIPTPENFAFLGAYFFSLQMLFRRYVRKDLRANAYVSVALRIILAVIGIWVVTSAYSVLPVSLNLAPDSLDTAFLVIAFVVGAFPPVMWQITRAAFEKITLSRFFVPSLKTAMPISDLDGLTVWHEARLEEEDIENVPNMATADIVELMLHTKFPPDRIIEWVDQAILYSHLGSYPSGNDVTQKSDDNRVATNSAKVELSKHGIRTATSLISRYYYTKDWSTIEELNKFEALLPFEGCSRIASLIITLGTNPNLLLIQNWKRMSPFVGYSSSRFDEQKSNKNEVVERGS